MADRRDERDGAEWGGRAGLAGHLARAVVFTLIGIFVIKAALEYDPNEAIGFDGTLQKLAGAAYGPYLLGLTAAGLLCYALYCLVDARYRDVGQWGRGGRWRSHAVPHDADRPGRACSCSRSMIARRSGSQPPLRPAERHLRLARLSRQGRGRLGRTRDRRRRDPSPRRDSNRDSHAFNGCGHVADSACFGLKDVIERTRPFVAHPQIDPLYVVHSSSFPAGHAATAFAGATLLSYIAPRVAPGFLLLAARLGTRGSMSACITRAMFSPVRSWVRSSGSLASGSGAGSAEATRVSARR